MPTEVSIHPRRFTSFSEASSFIWSIADLLRGDYKQHDYGKVILPFTVLRRLDSVLADTKAKVLARHASLSMEGKVKTLDPILQRLTGVAFHNTSPLDFGKLVGDPDGIAQNLLGYVNGFSENVRDVFIERFKLPEQIQRLEEADLLYLVTKRFAEVDLHPEAVPNAMMGSIFEDLIRRFAEQANETAGEHFTPREVIRLMVALLFTEDEDSLMKPGTVRTLYDPACGTGGMLSVAEEYARNLYPDTHLEVFGQELNDESYAICLADMLLKAENPGNVARGNSFSNDGFADHHFDYMLSNPPFGVEWKKVEKAVRDEHEQQGFAGRFGPGLPRINDGSLLFLMHMISKMKPVEEGGSRLAIVFNGSPLFTGDAGSGESEIRRWILENDLLEAIVALPDQLFFNTGISTYVWLVSNRKAKHRRGKVQLINAVDLFRKMRKSLGNKRNEMADEHIAEVVRLYGEAKEGERSKVFPNEAFGFRKIVVERPLQLRFQVTPDGIARVEEAKPFQGLARSKKKGEAGRLEKEAGEELQSAILELLRGTDTERIWLDRAAFRKDLKAAAKQAGVKIPAPIEKVLLGALSERDPEAEVCRDKDGNPEPDTDLRDTESVPLGESVEDYVAREVLPHVPDAWVDASKERIGYEIPFTRHFYRYQALRPLEEIEAEIAALEEGIAKSLTKVTA
ncbi:MAG: SAM-dependent DNA methyltransferase [Polyangiaceae bacterium]|nr:SAM-dependent DNA methyltransferase [Polyangiaceae bacterium]